MIFNKHFDSILRECPSAIKYKEETPTHPDKCIDENFPGYPNPASTEEEIINPQTKKEEVREKANKLIEVEEENSEGSANAFANTESLIDDEK
jgi:hypothetical protein